jgi:parallel beta-helix repeat protein
MWDGELNVCYAAMIGDCSFISSYDDCVGERAGYSSPTAGCGWAGVCIPCISIFDPGMCGEVSGCTWNGETCVGRDYCATCDYDSMCCGGGGGFTTDGGMTCFYDPMCSSMCTECSTAVPPMCEANYCTNPSEVCMDSGLMDGGACMCCDPSNEADGICCSGESSSSPDCCVNYASCCGGYGGYSNDYGTTCYEDSSCTTPCLACYRSEYPTCGGYCTDPTKVCTATSGECACRKPACAPNDCCQGEEGTGYSNGTDCFNDSSCTIPSSFMSEGTTCDSDMDSCTNDVCDISGTCIFSTWRDSDSDLYIDWLCDSGNDCDDLDININPGAIENCINMIDDNCDGNTDCADMQCSSDPACIPIYTEFDGATTDFSGVPDLTHVLDCTLEDTAHGMITWTDPAGVNVVGANFDANVNIGDGFISINEAGLDLSLASSAHLKIYNFDCASFTKLIHQSGFFGSAAAVVSGGTDCVLDGVCQNVVCAGNTLEFDVTALGSGYAPIVGNNVAVCGTINSPGYYTVTVPLTDLIPNDAVPCISIESNDVIFDCQGFSITNGINDDAIVFNSSNVTIMGCSVSNCGDAVFCNAGSEFVIYNNTFSNNNDDGIELSTCDYGNITLNTINVNTMNGILSAYTNHTVIDDNGITMNGNTGIDSDHDRDFTISRNSIISNTKTGIEASTDNDFDIGPTNTIQLNNNYGIDASGSITFVIHNNTINSNSWDGILIAADLFFNMTDNQIFGNGLAITGSGIQFDDTDLSRVEDNAVYNNFGDGVLIFSDSDTNWVIHNNVTTNQLNGIHVVAGSDYNNITTNNITGNSQRGVWIGTSCQNNTVWNNFIVFHPVNGRDDGAGNKWNILKSPGPNMIGGKNISGNYWDDYAGIDLTGDGIGDTNIPHPDGGLQVVNGDFGPLTNAFGDSFPTWIGDDWPMFGRVPSHAGYSNISGPLTNNTYGTFPAYLGKTSPICVDDVIYLYSIDNDVIYAVDSSTMLEIWSNSDYLQVYPGSGGGAPAYYDGMVFASVNKSGVYQIVALNATTGIEIWNRTVNGGASGITVDGGELYVTTWGGYDPLGNTGKLYVLDTSSGNEDWTYVPINKGFVYNPPAVGGGHVYFSIQAGGGYTDTFYAVNISSHTTSWYISGGSGNFSYACGATYGYGMVYHGVDSELRAYNADTGALIWSFSDPSFPAYYDLDCSVTPSLSEGVLYFATHNTTTKVYALDAITGAHIWNKTLGVSVEDAKIAISANGVLYLAGYPAPIQSSFYALNKTDNSLIWEAKMNYTGARSSPAICQGSNKVVVGWADSKLYVFGEAEAAITVSNCANLTQANKVYKLDTNLSGVQPGRNVCIDVQADNVTLDCDGYYMTGSGASFARGIDIINRKNVTVTGCTINGYSEYAIYMISTNYTTVDKNRLLNVSDGQCLQVGNGMYNRITSNYFNHLDSLAYCGISMLSYNKHDYIYNNTILDYGSIYIEDNDFNETVSSNTITGSDVEGLVGILLYTSSNNTIFNNVVSGMIGDYQGCTSIDVNSRYNNFSYNHFSNCHIGIAMRYGALYNKVWHNWIVNTTSVGIWISDDFGASYNNMFWDNYIDNAVNVDDSSTGNFWNTTYNCIAKKNIVGGVCMGGNYWSDYNGTDTDGDGIGNTELPWKGSATITNGGDYRPLINYPLYEWPMLKREEQRNAFSQLQGNFQNGTNKTCNITLIHAVAASPSVAEFNSSSAGLEIVTQTMGNPGTALVYVLSSNCDILCIVDPAGGGAYGGGLSTPAIGNLDDSNTAPEIVVASQDNNVYRIANNCTVDRAFIPPFPPANKPIYTSPVIGDVNSDGLNEVALGSSNGGPFYLFDSNLTPICTFATGSRSSPAFADLDNNASSKEIVFVNESCTLLVLYNNCSVYWSAKLAGTGCWSSPAVADIQTDDSNLEIAINGGNRTYIYQDNGVQACNYNMHGDERYASPAVGQLNDSDADLEIATGNWELNRTFILDSQCNLISNYTANDHVFWTSIADVDNDAENEVLFGSDDNQTYVINVSGTLEWNYSYDGFGQVEGGPVIADVDRDNIAEIIYNTFYTNNTTMGGTWVIEGIPEAPFADVTDCMNLTLAGYTYTLVNNLSGVQSGRDMCIDVQADDVTLDCAGYNITHDDTYETFAVYVNGYDNVTIKNCNIADYTHGIFGISSNYSTIKLNNITSCVNEQVYCQYCHYLQVLSNNASIGSGVIGIEVEESNNTVIDSNYASDNGWDGILVNSCTNATITSNTMNNNANGGAGLDMYTDDPWSFVSGNTMINNSGNGLYMSSSDNTTVTSNVIEWSGDYGAEFYNEVNITVINNTVSNNNTWTGFYFSECYYSNILDNIANNNTNHGFYTERLHHSTLTNNSAWGNDESDLYIDDGCDNDTFINFTTGNTMYSFTFNGSFFVKYSNGTGITDPSGHGNISHYVSIVNDSEDAWMFLNISYVDPDDLGILDENRLAMARNNGTWETNTSKFTSSFGVNNVSDYVYANITSFGSIFAPLGGTSMQMNVTVLINGTKTSNFTNAGQPYNVTVIVKDNSTGNPVENATVALTEYVGYVPFALIQKSDSNFTNAATAFSKTDSNGFVQFTVIPTGGPMGYEDYLGAYGIDVEVDVPDYDTYFESFEVTNRGPSYVAPSYPVEVPNEGDLEYINAYILRVYDRIQGWLGPSVGGGENHNITVYDNGTTIGLDFNFTLGKPTGLNVTVINSTSLSGIDSAYVILRERNGFLTGSILQKETSSVSNVVSAGTTTDANGNVRFTVVATGGSNFTGLNSYAAAVGVHNITFSVALQDGTPIVSQVINVNSYASFPTPATPVVKVPNQESNDLEYYNAYILRLYDRLQGWLNQ